MKLIERPRRLRRTEALRDMIRETTLRPENFVYPLFVCEGQNVRREIGSMPGCYNLSVDLLIREVENAASAGVRSIILFGVPDAKDAIGTGAYAEDGITQRAIRAVKRAIPEMLVIADNCLCEYTDHGHCGVIQDGEILNDPSLELLSRTAVSQAEAGADVIAPSNMMDGFVSAIRNALDESGFEHLPIMSYAVKYASGFYGPFREAAQSAPQFGDRRGYQMDPANSREALKEARLDIREGADILMVKPALAYLDIIRLVRDNSDLPIAAYQVSGEYSMIKAAALKGWIDEDRIVEESLTSIKRAGADIILTYYAKEMAERLSNRR